MDNILLAKPQLPDGHIDWAVGESHIIRRNLFRHFPQLISSDILALNKELTVNDLEYQNAQGYKPLVDLLEEKYQAPVVITNGAKQALSASIYAVERSAFVENIFLQPIHWALLPQLIEEQGLDWETYSSFDNLYNSPYAALLYVAPGNPCGRCPTHTELLEMGKQLKNKNIPFILDSAYYTHSYLPEEYELGAAGDLQIFSFSKMLGLSGVRVGAVVCHNKAYYKDIVEYVEMMTVGVSIFSQKFVHSVFQEFNKEPKTVKEFERANFAELTEAKNILKGVSKKVLDVPENIDQVPGMFSFVKIIDPKAFEKAKIHIVSGEPFGDASKVRLNMAIGEDKMKEVVERLNEAVGGK